MKTRSILAGIGLIFAVGQALGGEIEKGVPEAPPNAKAVAGTYYSGDGLGYNVTLTLNVDGTYSSDWQGCLGKYGDSSGAWKLSDKRIVLTPANETGTMRGHLRTLDVLKYKEEWIFVRADRREFYNKHGVSFNSCFRKKDEK